MNSPMRIFIFKYLLIFTAIAVSFSGEPAKAQSLPDIAVPNWLESYKQQLWTPQGLLTLVVLGAGGYWIMSGDRKIGSRMASAHWGGLIEKNAAKRVAIKQINERKRDGLTT
jgi:hypothetical protein